MSNPVFHRILDLLDRVQPHLRHIPEVTHTEIEELRAVLCSALRSARDGSGRTDQRK